MTFAVVANGGAGFGITLGGGAPAQTLTPVRFDNTQTFYSATVTPGAVSLTPVRFDNSQTFYAPTVTRGAVSLTPVRFDNSQAFYTPTVTLGAVTLTPARFDNAQSFYSPTVALEGAPTQTLTPTRFDNAQTFNAHTIANGSLVPVALELDGQPLALDGLALQLLVFQASGSAQTLTAARFDNAQSFYNHILSLSGGPQTILPARFDNAQTFFAHEALPGTVGLLPVRFDNAQTFFGPTLTQGAAVISPTRFDNSQIFYSPTVTGGEPITVTAKRGVGKRNYLIQGKKFYLADWELQLLLQQLRPKRSEVQIVEKEDVKQISRKLWKRLRETYSALDALTFKQVDAVVQNATIEYDEDEELVMLLL